MDKCSTRYLHNLPRISEALMPLKFYASPDAFKIFLLDCGLLGCMTDTTAADMLTRVDGKRAAVCL